jgi:hypothetical protein
MMAALLAVASRRCRSRQLNARFVVPSSNHFACGGFQSTDVVGGLNQWRFAACSSQNSWGRSMLLR